MRRKPLRTFFSNNYSIKEKDNILALERYKNYSEIYDGDKEAVWQEFIADVFSGMSSYTENYIDVVADYRYGGEAIDRFSPAVYNDIIDAGGNAEILDSIGIVDTFLPDTILETLNNRDVKKANMSVFPPYHESFSEANELASRWAHKSEIAAGTQEGNL